jgi:hypothetical protein
MGTNDEEEKESMIYDQMLENYNRLISLYVKALIFPAFEIIKKEHQFDDKDFSKIVKESPLIPKGREKSFIKLFRLGFDDDFLSVMYFLIPQIENFVRFYLNQNNTITTCISEEGISTENSMNSLLKMNESKELFGEDLLYELKALFCEPLGFNLRNLVAHGLIDDDECNSCAVMYAWWLVFKIVFNTWYNFQIKNGMKPEDIKLS